PRCVDTPIAVLDDLLPVNAAAAPISGRRWIVLHRFVMEAPGIEPAALSVIGIARCGWRTSDASREYPQRYPFRAAIAGFLPGPRTVHAFLAEPAQTKVPGRPQPRRAVQTIS